MIPLRFLIGVQKEHTWVIALYYPVVGLYFVLAGVLHNSFAFGLFLGMVMFQFIVEKSLAVENKIVFPPTTPDSNGGIVGDKVKGEIRMSGVVKVRIVGSRNNKKAGFYLLMLAGDTSSIKPFEFVIDESSVEILKKNNIGYEVLRNKNEE